MNARSYWQNEWLIEREAYNEGAFTGDADEDAREADWLIDDEGEDDKTQALKKHVTP